MGRDNAAIRRREEERLLTPFRRGFEDLQEEVKALRLAAMTRQIEDYYKLGKLLGEGSYAQVFKAVKRGGSNEAVAVKKMSKTHTKTETFWKEVSILRAVSD